MNIPPIELHHGERYGRLTVLRKVTSKERGPRYMVGCECRRRFEARATQLMRGEVKSCHQCANGKAGA